MEKTLEQIAEELQVKHSKLRTLTVSVDKDRNWINLCIDKYRYGDNAITGKQIEYIESFRNARLQSNSTMSQMNKWCASAVIDALKGYPEVDFYICKGCLPPLNK